VPSDKLRPNEKKARKTPTAAKPTPRKQTQKAAQSRRTSQPRSRAGMSLSDIASKVSALLTFTNAGARVGAARAFVVHLAITPLTGVAAILRLHSRVKPFPSPVVPSMSLFNVFKLAPLGVEAMTPDLSDLRRALGNGGLVSPDDARGASTVGDLVELVE
jgi:hypothetical protein